MTSTDDAIAAHCQAIVAQLSPEDQADASRAQRCLAALRAQRRNPLRRLFGRAAARSI